MNENMSASWSMHEITEETKKNNNRITLKGRTQLGNLG
jgi:hypothetical protein